MFKPNLIIDIYDETMKDYPLMYTELLYNVIVLDEIRCQYN